MQTLQQLTDLRARLVRAQRRENAAIRKMSEFSLNGGDKAIFKRLLDDVHRARLESVNLYEQWNAAVQAAEETAFGESHAVAKDGASSDADVVAR